MSDVTDHDRLEARIVAVLRRRSDALDRPAHSLTSLIERAERTRPPAGPERRWGLAAAVLAIGLLVGLASGLLWSGGGTDLRSSDEAPPADGTASSSPDTRSPVPTSGEPPSTAPLATTGTAPGGTAPPAGTWIVAPLLDLSGPTGQGVVIGRWDGGAWVPPSEEAPDLAGTDRWLGLDGALAPGLAGPPEAVCGELSSGGAYWVVSLPGPGRGPVGVPAGVDPRPRPVTDLVVAPEHVESVRSWAAGRDPSLGRLDTTVTRAVRVDLEGDGTDEVVLVASRLSNGEVLSSLPAGDHSVVLIRRVGPAGGVETVEVTGDLVTTGDPGPESGSDNAVNWVDLAAIADLDGDGVMELVVATRQYEGWGVALYSATDPQPLLQLGCGA